MIRARPPLSRTAASLSRAVVVALLCALWALTIAQQFGTVGPWWLEMSRYLPYPALLGPAVLASLMAVRLGRTWGVCALATVALVLGVTMGLSWRFADTAATGTGPRLRMMTYNIKALKAMHREDGIAALAREVGTHDPDVLVMQDANWWTETRAETSYWAAPVFGLRYAYAVGQYVIASRFALHDCATGHMDYRGERQRYVHCMVELPGHAVHVVTAHFESPRSGLIAARRDGIDGVFEWRRNYEDRHTQATELAHDLANSPRPLIVAGDLNAPVSSSVIRTLLDIGLRDAYSCAGRGYGYSYGQALKWGFSFLRIDHILVSPEFVVEDSFAGGGDASDHRPVIADLRFSH